MTSIKPAQPWDGATRKLGIIPDQAILYPRPVILFCGECAAEAYWYPKANVLELYSNHCERYVEGGHSWYVLNWNLNEVIETGETP
jgi:hypothetical protein